MRFFRVRYTHDHGSSAGCGWFTASRDAEKAAKRWIKENPGEAAKVEIIDILPTKVGILGTLNRYASRPDNG